jgi:hypothetical protein
MKIDVGVSDEDLLDDHDLAVNEPEGSGSDLKLKVGKRSMKVVIEVRDIPNTLIYLIGLIITCFGPH